MDQELPFGRLVRERRRALDLTQDELARRVGCAPVTLRKIEYGDMRPSEQIAERLAMALAVPLDERPSFVRQARAVRRDGRKRDESLLAPLIGTALPGLADQGGQTVRGYQLGAQLGRGGFGAVYLAVQPLLEREVAVKVILPQYADHPDFIRRFEAEAQLVARLEHPHIVPLYDYWREPGVAYLVMRYLRGGSLHGLLQQGPPPITRTVALVDQLSAALEVAHLAGVVHRDLKPANVLFDEAGNAYLADFGIAKDLRRPAELSFAGAFVGSPAYSSPEQIRAEPVTPQTDIYALGVLLFELLTGQKPFPGPTPALLVQQHLNEPAPPLSTRRSGLAPALDQILQRALAKVPTARYGAVGELAAALRAAVAPEPALVVQVVAPVRAAPPTELLDLDDADNPYPGLRPFVEADAARYFGREALVQQLLVRLGEGGELHRFLAVIGPSGSGKSSVVRAGLLPALRAGALPGSEEWFFATLLPGPAPLRSLAEALATLAPAGLDAEGILSLLRADERGLLRAARLVLPSEGAAELVLMIDQFEELFTLCNDEPTRAHLLDSLVTATLDERSRLRLVLTLRADMLDRPLQYVDFGELLRQRGELVLPLTADELEQAILGPARRAGLALEDGLSATLVGAVAQQPGALPLLQHALSELFLHRQGRVLTRAAYAAIGGVSGALAGSAEAVYAGLGEGDQGWARQLFLRLVTPGEGNDDLRRRVRRSELAALGADGAVSAFGQARLLTLDRDEQTREPTVEVAHEALLREWPRLRGWVEGAREELLVQRRLAQAADEWVRAGREPSFLATGGRLAQFVALATGGTVELTAEERDYTAASQGAEAAAAMNERERQARELAQARATAAAQSSAARRLRYLVGALAIFLLAAVGLSAFAYRNQAEAVTQRQLALSNLNRSEAQRLAAEATSLLRADGNAELTALLAIRSLQIEYTPQGDAALAGAELLTYPRQLLVTQTGPIWSVAFAPDGRAILTGGNDGSAQLWDVERGVELQRFVGHTAALESVAFSEDGALALSGSDDQTARLWNVQTGQELQRFVGHEGLVYSVAFRPGSDQVLTASADGTARLWDIQTSQELRRFTVLNAIIRGIAVAPDGLTMLTGSDDALARQWDLRTGQELRRFAGHLGSVNHIAYAPDGSTMLTSSDDTSARLWDIGNGEELRSLAGHTSSVNGGTFSPDGQYVLTSGQDQIAILWNAETGEQLGRFAGHTGFVWDVAFSPDGASLVTGSFDGTARVWDIEAPPHLPILPDPSGVLGVAVSPDGTAVLTGGLSGITHLWDARTGTELRTFVGHTGPVVSIAFSPDGQYSLTNSSDKTVRLWDMQTGTEVRQFVGHTDLFNLNTVAFSPDSRYALTGNNDMTVRLWDVQTGSELRRLQHDGEVFAVAFSPDGRLIVSGAYDGTARLWDTESGTPLRVFQLPGDGAASAVFSPEGGSVLTGSWDGTVRLWDAETGVQRQVLSGHGAPVMAAAFSPDGAYALTGSGDGTARLWDVETGAQLRVFTGHMGEVTGVAFSRDGEYVLTGSLDGTTRTWNADYQETINYLCARLQRDLTPEERTQYSIPDDGPTCGGR